MKILLTFLLMISSAYAIDNVSSGESISATKMNEVINETNNLSGKNSFHLIDSSPTVSGSNHVDNFIKINVVDKTVTVTFKFVSDTINNVTMDSSGWIPAAYRPSASFGYLSLQSTSVGHIISFSVSATGTVSCSKRVVSSGLDTVNFANNEVCSGSLSYVLD